jgi:deoxyribonuclease-4
MVRTAERARAIGADSLQLFADNPTAWRRRAGLPDELPAFRAKVAELGLGPLAIHAAYLINLAGPDAELFERSLRVLSREMAVAPAYGARFVNVHVGSHRGAGVEAGIARVAEGVARVLAETPRGADEATLVLENSAGGGDGLGTSVDELARILYAIEARGVTSGRVGICLDTAHLWGAGIAIETAEEVDALVAAIASRIGLERLLMVHLNDSKVAFGSRADRHQHLAAGEIGSDGLARVLTHPALAHVAYYLETPGMDEGYDAVNMARARDLAVGVRPAPLPPEALDLRGSRARAAEPA